MKKLKIDHEIYNTPLRWWMFKFDMTAMSYHTPEWIEGRHRWDHGAYFPLFVTLEDTKLFDKNRSK